MTNFSRLKYIFYRKSRKMLSMSIIICKLNINKQCDNKMTVKCWSNFF